MRARRVDSNHAEIVAEFRKLGATVWDTSRCGGGAPDIVIGAYLYSVPVEIKSPGGELNEKQIKWHEEWLGSKYVIWDKQGVQTIMDTLKYMAGHARD